MKTRPIASSQRSGFTVLELLVVMTVIGLLVAIAGTAFQMVQTRSKHSKTQVVIKVIEAGLDQYWKDNGIYPLLSEGKEGEAVNGSTGSMEGAGAIMIYQALSGDGDDYLEGGKTSSTGQIGQLYKPILGEGDLRPGGTSRMVATDSGKYFVIDGWGAPFQYKTKKPKGKDAAAAEAAEKENQTLHNPQSYDLWSTGGKQDNNTTTWITNWN